MFLLLASLATAAPAGCPRAQSDASVRAIVDRAERAFTAMDADAFLAAEGELRAAVGCVDQPLPLPTVSAVHRVAGIAKYVRQDTALARAAFAAARTADPEYRLPEALVPSDHQIREEYVARVRDDRDDLAPPFEGSFWFDGAEGLARPTSRPTIAQLVGPDGTVARGAYLWPDDPLFAYDVAGEPVAEAPPASPTTTKAATTEPATATARPTKKKGLRLGVDANVGMSGLRFERAYEEGFVSAWGFRVGAGMAVAGGVVWHIGLGGYMDVNLPGKWQLEVGSGIGYVTWYGDGGLSATVAARYAFSRHFSLQAGVGVLGGGLGGAYFLPDLGAAVVF
ncbi:MAG: hypothetical protein ACOZNI_08920 [Myxococcota bacterium]